MSQPMSGSSTWLSWPPRHITVHFQKRLAGGGGGFKGGQAIPLESLLAVPVWANTIGSWFGVWLELGSSVRAWIGASAARCLHECLHIVAVRGMAQYATGGGGGFAPL